MFRRLSLFLLFQLSLFATSRAHPVAQGSLEVDIERDALRTTFRVSNEQIFVASTFGPGLQGSAAPTTLEAMWQEHATYLLAHIHVTADSQGLKGEFVRLTPPGDTTTKGFTLYELRLPFVAPAPSRWGTLCSWTRSFATSTGRPW